MRKHRWFKPSLAVLGLGAAVAVALWGCATFRWSGTGRDGSSEVSKRAEGAQETFGVNASTRPARRRPADYLPKTLTKAQEESLYYSDLGPDEIDVSGYPREQRYNYVLYSHACSQCHTLARSINAPMVSRSYWEFYILGMRFTAYFRPETPLKKAEIKEILDFLEYDSRVRKIERRSEFEELTDELKRRFGPLIQSRLRQLQRGKQPVILRPEQR